MPLPVRMDGLRGGAGRTDSRDRVDRLAGARVVLAHGQQAAAPLVHRRVREAVPVHVRQLLRRAHLGAQALLVQLLVLQRTKDASAPGPITTAGM